METWFLRCGGGGGQEVQWLEGRGEEGWRECAKGSTEGGDRVVSRDGMCGEVVLMEYSTDEAKHQNKWQL